MNPPRLQSQRLIIQPMDVTDATTLYAYRSHPDVVRFQSMMFKNEREAQHFIQNHQGFDFGIPETWFQLGIYLKPEQELIGDIGVHFLDKNLETVEIGYTITPAHQRNGYAFEVVHKFLDFLFKDQNTNTVIGITNSQNRSSIKLLARLGFQSTDPVPLHFDFQLLPDELVFTLPQTLWKTA